MSKENIEIIKKLFEAVEKRDAAGVFGVYDENIVIREASSLPYGGEFHGLAGALQHAQGYRKIWDNLQTSDKRKMNAKFLDAGEYVIVLWRQRAAKDNRNLDLSAMSVYKLRDGKIVESEMFQDTWAILEFLSEKK